MTAKPRNRAGLWPVVSRWMVYALPTMQDEVWDAADCIARVRAGDEDAARTMLQRLYPLVLKLVRAHLPRRCSEEDLVQSVFLKVFSKLGTFSGTVPLEHWVSRIAVNTCFNELDRERVRPELRWADLSEEEEQVLGNLARAEDELPGDQSHAARELVKKLVEDLDPADRLLVTLLHLEERSVEEVSQMTGWNRGVVKVRAFRARQRMKKRLQRLLKAQME
ncbi:MAG: RNA polymerase sigma factor [Limisphaerales bacterium]